MATEIEFGFGFGLGWHKYLPDSNGEFNKTQPKPNKTSETK